MVRKVLLAALAIFVLSSSLANAQKKKKKGDDEDVTQTLPLLKDPPFAVSAETARLVFHLSPLSAKGLLTQQLRDALKSLFQQNHGAAIVKLRAFVAGSADLRRVQTVVSEVFTDRKLPLPAVSTIQVGALPLDGAQVIFESVSEDKKPVNPDGLAFFSSPKSKTARDAVEELQKAATVASIVPRSVLRVTCYLASLDELTAARAALMSVFPAAMDNFVQPQRLALEPLAQCEATARLETPPASAVVFANPQLVLVNAPKLVFTGAQMAFGEQGSDLQLAFERLGKELEMEGASYKDVVWSEFYSLTSPVAAKMETIRGGFYDHSHPISGPLLLFEGLPSIDASAAVEVIAAPQSEPVALK